MNRKSQGSDEMDENEKLAKTRARFIDSMAQKMENVATNLLVLFFSYNIQNFSPKSCNRTLSPYDLISRSCKILFNKNH